ncbi:MAG: CPBP family intramembrane metalloprotease [Fimbriimonadaceae bacterium]|nr:CPBP family intramembrane metalloprotease [Fimbriimonadaceae bacterium]
MRPAGQRWSPPIALASVVGCALLMNKRYLADRSIVDLPVLRWQAVAAWLAALAVAFLVSGRANRVTGALLAVGGGLAAMAAVLAVAQFDSHSVRTLAARRAEVGLMLTLVWVVVAPVLVYAANPAARPRRAALLAALAAGALLALRALPGPWQRLLIDARYDKFNWGLLTFAWLCAVPLLVSAGCDGRRPRADGLGLGRWRFWLAPTAGCTLLMVVLIVAFAGRQPSFQIYYPMFRGDFPGYNPWEVGWGYFVGYELTYAAYFVAWEFFFRGWMLFRLERHCGPTAIVWQTIPFVLLHIGKPGPEFHSSLLAGLVLGWLAWRGRSCWPCFLLHFTAAFTMDLTALLGGAR